ncbi:hypothetical protein BUALT_Bualt12G0092800 [Buddleja alternifolia]|uniref:Uncharacterized protein n=1 Tax=Buddleja alternifolia TaxID=168488 RepID=A0AAV6X0J7_9LAMI|nr:hypothetical protein BUALT_Bualt12G0092800 [Buddleja alternifolia]
MSGVGSIVEPHDKMRGRDVNKVARGEQAPRPPQQSPQVSRAPPPSSTNTKVETESSRSSKKLENSSNPMRRCYESYNEYHKCIQERGSEAPECKKGGGVLSEKRVDSP